jgi:hypothetical protein
VAWEAGKSCSDIGYHGGSDYFVTKIDSSGNLIWKKMLGGSLNDFGHAVKTTYDGGYVVVGETISNNDGDVTGNIAGQDNMWVVKLSADGGTRWTGDVSTDWEDPSNWLGGVLPNMYSNVIINSGLTNYPVIHSNITINALDIRAGASVTVTTGNNLKVTKR